MPFVEKQPVKTQNIISSHLPFTETSQLFYFKLLPSIGLFSRCSECFGGYIEKIHDIVKMAENCVDNANLNPSHPAS